METYSLKLTQTGTSTCIVLPKELLAKMGVKKGDRLSVHETPEGYMLTPHDAEFERQLKIGRAFLHRYRETFKALSKL